MPNPMEVLAGSIVRTSLRCISSIITTTSGFPRHVCGARVFYMFNYGREKEISLFAHSDVIGWDRGEALYPTLPE